MRIEKSAIRSNIWIARISELMRDHDGAVWHRADAGRLLEVCGMPEKARMQYELAVRDLLRVAESTKENNPEYAEEALKTAAEYSKIIERISSKLRHQAAAQQHIQE